MFAVRRWRPIVVALAFLAVSAGIVVGLPPSQAATTLTVWPVGDSITYGSEVHPRTVPGGYRVQLARDLAARGIRVHFVGTVHTNPAFGLAAAGQSHDGHPGWQTSDVLDHLAQWQVPRPDVILIHLGTNDLGRGHAMPATAAERLTHLIAELTTRFPDASVVVAAIVPRGRAGSCDSSTREYDGLVRTLVRQQRLMGHDVSLADAWADFNAGLCSIRRGLLSHDALHPSAAGYRTLARTFADVVAPLAESRRTLTP